MRAFNGKIKISKTKEKALRKLLFLSNVFYNEILAVALEAADVGTIFSHQDLIRFEQGSLLYSDVPSDIRGKMCQRVALWR